MTAAPAIDLRAAATRAHEASPPAAAIDADWTDAASLADQAPPPRQWVVTNWIPRRAVTLLSGDGGVGKSLLCLQLCVATASGGSWLGLETEPGPAVALFCEDDADEVHRRLVDVSAAADVEIATLGGFSFCCPPAVDVSLFSEHDAIAAQRWRSLLERLMRMQPRPVVIVIDAAADVFDANESDRAKVRRFLRMLRGLALELDAAVVLISHPSRAGLAARDLLSGSTAWGNSVRSRLTFDAPKRALPDLRELQRVKGNYAARGEGSIMLRWDAGAFVVEGRLDAIAQQARAAQADRVFMALFAKMTDEGQVLRHSPGPHYAPKLMAERDEAERLTAAEFRAAMNRCLGSNRVEIVDQPGRSPSKAAKMLRMREPAS